MEPAVSDDSLISVPECLGDTPAPHSSGNKRKLDAERSHYARLGAWRAQKTNHTRVLCWEGSFQQQRVVRIEINNGTKFYCEGDASKERVVRGEFPNGQKVFFKGDAGSERVVRGELPNGNKMFYEGESGQERLVRVE